MKSGHLMLSVQINGHLLWELQDTRSAHSVTTADPRSDKAGSIQSCFVLYTFKSDIISF
jgi:hypothetical protein